MKNLIIFGNSSMAKISHFYTSVLAHGRDLSMCYNGTQYGKTGRQDSVSPASRGTSHDIGP